MADQHRYDVPQVVTENMVRVRHMLELPQADPTSGTQRKGMVEVLFEFGEEVGGDFIVVRTEAINIPYHELGSAMRDTLDTLEDKALAAGVSRGIFPAGTSEPIP